jgi:CheY-like chemotaxis protein/HPt (histidine-containing phosphotransfer) domain-containing protein
LHDTLPSAHRSKLGSRPAAPHRVLLVEDDAVSMEILSVMLNHDGHDVMCANDGEAALNLLSSFHSEAGPDVLLVDMQMPGISGQELARRVRTLRGAKPLLLAMSATAANSRQLRGFDGFLLKPLAIDDLRQALQSPPLRSRPQRSPSKKSKEPTADATPDPISQASGEQDIVDQAVLNKLAKAMPAHLLTELLQACIVDSRQRVEALKGMARAGRMAEIPRAAHQIKGAGLMIGAVRIARLASALEIGSCKEDTLRLLDDLLNACDALERMLLAGKLHRANHQ